MLDSAELGVRVHRRFRVSLWSLLLIALSFGIQTLSSTQNPASRIPFVGCKSDGQAGPQEAPIGTEVEVRVDAATAIRLALYKAENGPAVLGPRQWSCFGTYGSSGALLYVTPSPLKPSDTLDSKWEGITSGGILASSIDGDTSGRFLVAQIAARVFPAQRSFVDKVIAEGIEPTTNFTFGPFPNDRLTYLSDQVVEYETAPRAEGLGTSIRVRPNNDAIVGTEVLRDLVLRHMALRLPQNMKDLAPIITKQFEMN